jgi:hypothetical protein
MSISRGQSVFNTSEIKNRGKHLIRKNQNALNHLKLISIKGLSENQLNKDVITYISKLLKNKNSTSSASSSHIRDPNNFNNFNKKKIIEFIKNKIPFGIGRDPTRLFTLDNISEIENMNKLIIPSNPNNLTDAQAIISLYYNISIMYDILHIKTSTNKLHKFRINYFNDVLNSSRFNIKKSDRKFFIFKENLDSSNSSSNSDDIKDPNNPYFKIYNIHNYIEDGISFYFTFFLMKSVNHWDSFAIALILIVRYIHFKEVLKEILYMNNNYKQYNVHHVNDMRNEILHNISLRREENRLGNNDIKIQLLLNLVEKIFYKTFKKIIKELGR